MATHSFGTFIGFFASTQLRAIGEVRTISGPGKSTTAADGSHLRVTNALKAFVAGLKDGGEATFTVNFTGGNTPLGSNPTPGAGAQRNYSQVFALWRDRTDAVWRITYPGTLGFEQFYAFVTGLSTAVPEDDVITADVTLKASGDEGVGRATGVGAFNHLFSPAS